MNEVIRNEVQTEFSASLGALAKALAKAQGELSDAVKDAVNPHFKNKYATLSSVRAAITPVFSRHGLAVTQLNEPHGDSGVCVVTLLMHESGEWLRSRLFVPVTKKDPQGFGSALSYARRYALASIANIASDDDDDAEHASRPARVADVRSTQAQGPSVQGAVDVEALVVAIVTSKDAAELAAASTAVGRVKARMSKADIDRCLAAHSARLRTLGQAA